MLAQGMVPRINHFGNSNKMNEKKTLSPNAGSSKTLELGLRLWIWGYGGQTQPILSQPGGSNLKSQLFRRLRAGGSPVQGHPRKLSDLKPQGRDQCTHQRFGGTVACCYFRLANSPTNGKSVELKKGQCRQWAPRDVREP